VLGIIAKVKSDWDATTTTSSYFGATGAVLTA
jgi:hypothetical protein